MASEEVTITPGPASTEAVEIWTDGGCKPNPGPGGWAAVMRFKGAERELSGADAATTNNRMELTAATMALEALKAAVSCRVAHRQRIPEERGDALASGVGTAELAQLGRRSGGQHGVVAASAGCCEGARDRMALGARTFRRCDERASRQAGHRGADQGRLGDDGGSKCDDRPTTQNVIVIARSDRDRPASALLRRYDNSPRGTMASKILIEPASNDRLGLAGVLRSLALVRDSWLVRRDGSKSRGKIVPAPARGPATE